jgi:snRNA-activating protein complex subunit 3
MVIDKWAKDNPEMNLGPFEQKKMEDNTIGDLEIRLGFPYVFIHLGNCEHIITFVDAR